MKVQRADFPGAEGQRLAARVDVPDGPLRAYALFAHCFTCGKDIFAASRIAQTLTEHGICVLRFDFTGLGASEGGSRTPISPPTLPIWSRRPTICANSTKPHAF